MNKLLGKILPRLFVVLATATAAAIAEAQPDARVADLREIRIPERSFSRGVPPPAWAEILPVPPPDATKPVVIRLADTQVRLGAQTVHFIHRAIQVNDSAALSQIGQYAVLFVPEFHHLRLHKIAIERGPESFDKTHSVNLRFLQRETELERGIYSGTVTLMMILDDVRAGDTLHVMYSIEGENPIFDGKYSQFVSWDQSEPALLRRVTMAHPPERRVAWRLVGDHRESLVKPQISDRDGLKHLVFLERNLEKVFLEERVPSSYLAFRTLQFSEFEQWNDVARWAAQLFDQNEPLPEEAERVVARLRALSSPDARISAALQWVQSEIRYFSVALGESSHRPYPPKVVMERRYGDCKDKSFLLMALLRRLGIDARPVLVSASAPEGLDKLLPSPLLFDHVIVRVDSGARAFYLDPTRLGQSGALERMGQALEGAQVLVVAAATSGLGRITSPNMAELVRQEVHEQIAIPAFEGPATLEVRQVFHGLAAESMRLSIPQSSPDQIRRYVTGQYDQRYPGAALMEEPVISDNSESNRVTIRSRFSLPKAAATSGSVWFVRFYPRNFVGAIPLPEQLSRGMPAAIATHPYEAFYSLEITWPEQVSALTDPVTNLIDNKHFSAEATRSFRGNRAKVDLTLRTKQGQVEPEDMRDLFAEIERLNRLVRGTVVVSQADIKGPGILGMRPTLQQQIRKRLEDAVKRTTEAIDAGKLQAEDMAEAHCLRAEALSDMGALADALRDAQEAVRLSAASPRGYECRASVRFNKSDFAGAADDYSKALALGGVAFHPLYRRGHARFYLGQLEGAAADFAQASEVTQDGSDALYADLWLVWTLQRQGKPLPRGLAERAAKDPRGEWPRAALAMLAGVLSPDEMLAVLDDKQGDDREMALAEAWFYLGQHHLIRNDVASAREAFQKAREKGMTVYIEHVAAGFELARIPSK